MDEAIDKMRGAPGSPITLTISRPAVTDPITVTIVRDVIKINPIQYSAEGDVGWIKIKTFESEQTSDYLKQAVEDLKTAIGPDLKGFILDLRNNPGGLLDEATAISDAFLEQGAIVIVKGRSPSDVERISAKPGDVTGGKPLVVLVNGGSASASEIVAGALQDYGRATIMGTRTFGKGSVQTIIPLGSHGALRLTTARYYTPSGRSIQATGIEPDYTVVPDLPADLKPQLSLLEGEAGLRGHLKNGSAPERRGSIAYVPKEKDKDVQLKAAIDFLHGIAPASPKDLAEHARAGQPNPEPATTHGG
jgi:carboxyl-terminal processing protease